MPEWPPRGPRGAKSSPTLMNPSSRCIFMAASPMGGGTNWQPALTRLQPPRAPVPRTMRSGDRKIKAFFFWNSQDRLHLFRLAKMTE